MTDERLARWCNAIHRAYHRTELIAPDPLEVARQYSDTEDREIAGLVAAALAVGRADLIVGAAREVMSAIVSSETTGSPESAGSSARTGSPESARSLRANLCRLTRLELEERLSTFSYRFFKTNDVVGLLVAIARAIESYGSVEALFAAGAAGDRRLASGLDFMVRELRSFADGALDRSILLTSPEGGSACKRMLLYLRWMVRSDSVDPGGWSVLEPRDLLVPVDVHHLAVARGLGLTRRSQPSWAAAIEITESYRRIEPDDPTRFDFALTRLGIHPVVSAGGIKARLEVSQTE